MFIPILHHRCYYSWSKCNPKSPSEAQKALQHAMWTLAASASVNYWTLRDQLYQHTCQILDSLERQGVHSSTLSIERVQAWLLLAIYELTTFGFRRAWVSAGKAFRLIQLDSSWTAATGLLADDDMHHGKGNHTSWVELEQRRRTFWFAYCLDRLLCLRNGSSPTFYAVVVLSYLIRIKKRFCSLHDADSFNAN